MSFIEKKPYFRIIYTILISTFESDSSLPLPQSFYSSLPGDFGRYDNLGVIDQSPANGALYHDIYDLDFLFKPEFEGGTLRLQKPYGSVYSYSQDFIVSSSETNTLDLNGNDAIFSGAWSNKSGENGNIRLSNSGSEASIVFSSDNALTGIITIDSKVTLQLGDGGATGSIAADVVNNGMLRFNRSGDFLIDTTVSVDGIVEMLGSGIKTVDGTLSSSGGVKIVDGTLRVGSGGQDGVLTSNADVASGAALEFNHSNIETYNGAFSGSGMLKVDSPGGLILAGDSSGFAGSTQVNGTLSVSGQLGGSVSVNSGGDLGGTGHFSGDVTVASGAKLVGLSTGGLTFDQGLSLKAGSILDLHLGVAGSSHALFNVGGNLTFENGTVINISDAGGFGVGVNRVFKYGTLSGMPGTDWGILPSGVQANHLSWVDSNNYLSIQNTAGVALDYWDGAGTQNGVVDGGSGIWSAASANQNWTDPTGVLHDNWTNDRFAIFAGIGGTVTVSNADGPFQVGGMQFAVDGYKMAGDNLALTSTGDKAIIRVGDSTQAGVNMTATIDNILTGDKGLEKADLGTLVLTADNIYSGGTTISGGVLQLGDGGATGNVQGEIIVGVDDLQLTKLIVKKDDDAIISNKISGTGQVEFVSDVDRRSYFITEDNTYTGGTNIKNIDLYLGNADGSVSAGYIDGDIHLDNGSINVKRSGSVYLNNIISGDAGTGTAISTSAASVVNLSGNNTFKGDVSIDGMSTLQISFDRNLGEINNSVHIADGTLKTTGSFNMARDIELQSVTSTIDTQSNTNIISGTVSGAGALNKSGTGTLVLTSENSFSGGTQVNAGTLQIGNGGEAGSVAGAVALVGTDSKVVIDRSNAVSVDGIISGAGGFVQQGSGTTTLTGLNTYAGGTDITDGTLRVGLDANLGAVSGYIKLNGGTLETSTSFDTASNVEIGVKNALIDTKDNTNTISGVVSGAGGLIKEGGGKLILTGENDFAGGSQVNDGVLQIGDGGTNGSIKGAVNLVDANSVLVIDLAKDTTLDGVLSGAGGVTQQGTGITTSTAANTYTGETNITDGELRLTSGGSIATSERLNNDSIFNISGVADTGSIIKSLKGNESGRVIVGNKTLIISDARDKADSTKEDIYRGTIDGDGGIKLAGGQQRLTGTNTYTGGTSIDRDATLIIGDGGTNGSVQNGIEVTGTLIYDRSDRFTVNELTGDGALQLKGGGIAVIDKKQNLGGEYIIDEGNTLALEGDGDISTGTGVTANGKLDITGGGNDQVRIGHLRGGDKGLVDLGFKTLVITDGDGSEFAGSGINGMGGLTIEKGKQLLAGNNTYTGDTLIKTGAELQFGNDNSRYGSITSNVVNEGIVSGSGSMRDLHNKGIVSPGTDANFATLNVNGDYSSDDGRLVLHQELADDNTKGDRLVITGNTSGTTEVSVVNRGGMGDYTVNGIKVISVGGQSDGVFNLNGDYTNYRGDQAVVAGAFAYTLEKGGISNSNTTAEAFASVLEADMSDNTDGSWYLRSQMKGYNPGPDPEPTPEYQAGVPLYGSTSGAIASLNRGGFASFGSRLNAGSSVAGAGSKSEQNDNQSSDAIERSNSFWGQVTGGYSFLTPRGSVSDSTYGSHDWRLQAGLDGQFIDSANGSLFGSIWLDYTRSNIDVWSRVGDGKVNVNGYGFGGALTWYGQNGFYLDGQGKVSWYRADMESSLLSESIASGVKSLGYALSLETGQAFAVNDRWTLTPHAQLIWSSLNTDDYRDVFNASINTPDNDTLTARFGFAADHRANWVATDGTATRLTVGGLFNVYQELKSGSSYIMVSDVRVESGSSEKTWGEIGATANYSWSDDAYSVFGKASVASSLQNFGDNYSVTGNVGFRVNW